MTEQYDCECLISKRKDNLIAQQAAVIEQMRDFIREIAASSNARTSHLLACEALALQPCPEVLNKVRAEARRQALHDAADDFEMGASADDIRCNAQRIE